MPVFRASEKLVYFAHVPKCAGSAVERYLRQRFGAIGFVDDEFYSLPQSLNWSRSSAQHIPVSILDRLFPAGFFDASFAVVRHPVERLVSEFHYVRDLLLRIDPSESFSAWLGQIDSVLATSPWLYDNHLRPMTDIVPEGATVFRLEDGLDRIIPYLDALVGRHDHALTFDRVLTRDRSIPQVVATADDIAVIERIYRQDYLRFGYDLTADPAPADLSSTALPAPTRPQGVVTARTDRSALAARFRDLGLGHFKDGNIPEAYANFRFALNCAPDDATIHGMIASAALRLGAVHLALHHAETALTQQPGQLDALLALAGARLKLKHPDVRASVEALSSFDQLGNFRVLLQMAVEAAEGNFETALVSVAESLEARPQDSMARELFAETFRTFRAHPDKERSQEFVDGVGVLAEAGMAEALIHPDQGQGAMVDLIVPVHNALAQLQNCLRSVRRWPSDAIHKIILVDDGSDRETAAWLDGYRDQHDDVILLRNAEARGVTQAVRMGIGQSQAPYMLLLTSDTEVTADWLDGMLDAMRAGTHTALVGPLSNCASHQSIRPGRQDGTDGPWHRSPDDFAALLKAISKRAFPRVPLLSGFSTLVHRGAFDRAGGIDADAFPHGDGPIEDLCLKLTDLGYDSVIADQVYVHRDDSTDTARGDTLSDHVRARLFERHSSLRVLIAEALCAQQSEVARCTAAVESLDRTLALTQKDHSKTDRPQVGPQVRNRCLKSPPDSLVERELCFFVTHCPLGAPHDYTITYLSELKRAGLLVVVCLVVEDLDIPVTDALMELVDGVLLRENGGYDFGAWADLMRRFPQAWGAGRLYFANDSILGPFQSLGPIIDRIRDRDAGFFALSECTMTKRHTQSFFFGWNQANLTSATVRGFWNGVQNFTAKESVRLNYELGQFGPVDSLNDPTYQIIFDYRHIFGCSPEDLPGVNPTHNGWKRLLAAGFPFVKADLLRDGVANVESRDWESVCANHGADPEALHRCIEASRINRLQIGTVAEVVRPHIQNSHLAGRPDT